MFFTIPKEHFDIDLKIKLNGKRSYETDSVKYLGNQIDKSLTWRQQISHTVVKAK